MVSGVTDLPEHTVARLTSCLSGCTETLTVKYILQILQTMLTDLGADTNPGFVFLYHDFYFLVFCDITITLPSGTDGKKQHLGLLQLSGAISVGKSNL